MYCNYINILDERSKYHKDKFKLLEASKMLVQEGIIYIVEKPQKLALNVEK